jgi:predicted naringenin-chalcone synthase
MSVVISGLGIAVPEHFIEQTDAAQRAHTLVTSSAKEQQITAVLYRRSGVKTRHSVLLRASTNGEPAQQDFFLPATRSAENGPTTATRMQAYENTALELATRAAGTALSDAKAEPDSITHIVTVSCSGFSAPGVDLGLIEQLGLPASVARTHVGFMGCHGALNGLRVARAFASADPNAVVLLVAVELCSLHYQYSADPQQLVANSLFADGAGALVIRTSNRKAPKLLASGSHVVPNTRDLMSWRIGDHGFEMTLSPKVPEVIRSELRPWMERWLAKQGWSLSDVAHWAVHPGGPRIVDACEAGLDLERGGLDLSREILARYGNMSSPTVLFVLDELRRQTLRGPCVLLGFGPGLAIEATLVELK